MVYVPPARLFEGNVLWNLVLVWILQGVCPGKNNYERK